MKILLFVWCRFVSRRKKRENCEKFTKLPKRVSNCLKKIIWSRTSSAGTHSKLSKTSKMERFTNMVNVWKPLTIFAKSSILDVWLGSAQQTQRRVSTEWIPLEKLCTFLKLSVFVAGLYLFYFFYFLTISF